jgi:uncharacterized membrane protein
MKKYFITGLVILLPLALTIAILAFFINFLTDPFMGIFRSILAYFNLMESGFLFFSAEQVQYYTGKILILVILVAFTILLGIIARWYFFHSLIRLWDLALRRIPLVRSIYKTSQDVIHTIFTGQTNSFKQVVLAPFPTPHAKSLGFVTSENSFSCDATDSPLITVFIPTTPNPTSGFLMMYPKESLIFLDMKVEDAFKYTISCGVIRNTVDGKKVNVMPPVSPTS